MSAFLGKIHYWLFNKILWFEKLEAEIISWAGQENLPVAKWQEEIYAKYESPLEERPLEELIDQRNIHGWLQAKINQAELRQAAWVTKIVDTKAEFLADLQKLFGAQGKHFGSLEKGKHDLNQPEKVFNLLNDYLLEGMPCDRVNKIVDNTATAFHWIATTCLHAPFWEEVGGQVENFYALRDSWITAFIEALDAGYRYQVHAEKDQRLLGILQ